MAAFVLTREQLPEFKARFERIGEQSQRQWGELTPAGMLRHLRRITEISLAEIEVQDQSNWFKRTIFCWLVFHVLPWPKGKIKVPPVFLPEAQGDVTLERKALLETLERFVAASEKEPARKTTHPLFGPRTMENWRLIHGKHFDHHLRQFGA